MTALAADSLVTFSSILRNQVGPERFDLWFRDNTRIAVDDGAVVVGVPNHFFREWLEGEFKRELAATVAEAFGKAFPVRFRIDPELFRSAYQREVPAVTASAEGTAAPKPSVSQPLPPRPPAPKPSRFALEHLVAGTPNRVAVAAARAMVERAHDSPSPLFIHGGIALGKTHLLRGIDEGIRRRHRDLKVGCFAGEEFTNEFVEALKTNKLPEFRKRVRALDVLLLDDVQFLAGKRATQVELLHTLEALQLRGGRLVLTADAHPRRLTRIGVELQSRFLAGMVVKLESPTREMRRQILLDKATRRDLVLDDAVVSYMAEHLRSNARELEGAVNYLAHYAAAWESPCIDLPAAQAALTDLIQLSQPRLIVADVVERACRIFGLDAAQLREKSRAHAVAHPRMLVLFLARRYTTATYREIGRQVGDLNHSAAIAAEKRIRAALAADETILLANRRWVLREAIDAFERELEPR